MPYINKTRRELLDPAIKDLENRTLTSGELNYTITKLILYYAGRNKHMGYGMIALICGVLENVKSEFYRRVVVPYKEENGDVYSG